MEFIHFQQEFTITGNVSPVRDICYCEWFYFVNDLYLCTYKKTMCGKPCQKFSDLDSYNNSSCWHMYYSLLPHRFSFKKTRILFWLQYISIVTAFLTLWCCTILKCYIKYIFSKTCFTLKLLELCSKFEVDISNKKKLSVRFCLGTVPNISTRWN